MKDLQRLRDGMHELGFDDTAALEGGDLVDATLLVVEGLIPRTGLRGSPMNLERDKAIEAMDVLTEHGYNATVDALTKTPGIPTVYGVSVPHSEDTELRELCDLAESIGLHCRYSLNAIWLQGTAHRRANA